MFSIRNQTFLLGFIRFIVVLLLASGFVYVTTFVWTYLYPFLFAVLLSIILRPFILLLQRRLRLPRAAAVLIVLALVGSLAASLVALVIAELIKGMQYIAAGLPEYFHLFSTYLTGKAVQLSKQIIGSFESLTGNLNMDQQLSLNTYLDTVQEKVTEGGLTVLNEILESLGVLLTSLPTSIAMVFITFLATFFLCKDWETIRTAVYTCTPPVLTAKAFAFRKEWHYTWTGLIKAQCTLVLISSVLTGIGLTIIGAPYVLPITIFTAFVDFIPYIGTGVVFLPWIIFQFFTGSYGMTIGLIIVYMVVIITRQVLEPKLLGDHFGVPPIILLAAMFTGFQLFGGYGIILSPLVLMIVQTLNKTGLTKEITAFIKGDRP
ncbi:sporulation integral membrane protein YtvI [Bacillus sp. SB49]|uniref:sporulation integral membrane protein YtvI n=1 Tax=Bacillaceae TaxID=186817 RepID=UPI0003FCFBB9|nr:MULTISPECIES: sporulation integral membrane protein YtvI [Bacillaceae]QHT47398.1 sporulation integral membrane protein YtvI [Bacillus sp. SB49]